MTDGVVLRRAAEKSVSDTEMDARRWRIVRQLTTIEINEMTAEARAAWDRLIRGGWYVGDLEAMLDALPEK